MLSLLLPFLLALPAPRATLPTETSGGVAASVGDKFEELKAAFDFAAVGGDAKARHAGLEALLSGFNPAAAGALAAEYTRITEIVDEQDANALKARGLIERKQVLIEQWKQRSATDDGAMQALERETKALEEQRKDLYKFEAKLDKERPWQQELAAATTRLLTALPAEKRKKLETELLTDATEHPSAPVRRASIDLLGTVGGQESGLGLARLAQGLGETCDKLEERLPKLMSEVHKMEARLAKEAGKQNDGFSKATYEQYDAVKRDAAELRTKISETDRLCDRAAAAAAIALSRGSGKEQDELGPTLLRAWKKSKGRGRRALLEVLSSAHSDALSAALRAQLAAETEPLSRAEWIGALVAQSDSAVIPDLIQKHLLDPAWVVRSSAVRALAELRSKEAIPALIARLALEEGRMRTDIGLALTSLTAKDFHGNVELWQGWWKDNAAAFAVAPKRPGKTALDEAKESYGVSFFGISTESQHVLFVIDCSLSMNFSMTPKNNPTDEPGKPYDTPDESKGESSRLSAAKRDLEKAISGIKDGGEFNIIGYAADVWSWDDTPAVMSSQTRKEALSYVNALEGAAGTNIYSALERAFDMSGAKSGSVWSKPAFDTIFFLTDGRATIGVTTNSEEILAYVRERNANAGIVLHTIGLSGAQDAQLLRRLAEENHGQYVAR